MNAELNRSTHVKAATRAARLGGAAALLAAATAFAAPNPPAAPAAAPVEVPIPKSVFVDRPDFGRDPFFPKSTRRGQAIQTTTTVQPTANFDSIVLKGISTSNEKRLAIINNKTFEAGEESDVRINGQPVRVKCVEIRDKSIIITVNGVSKELFLGSKF
jgi:hypothetical protein